MPAHVKSALIGASVTIPIRDGKLATGKLYFIVTYRDIKANIKYRYVAGYLVPGVPGSEASASRSRHHSGRKSIDE